MRLATLAVLAACGGPARPPSPPAAAGPRMMLVRCAAATPAPILEDDGVTFGGLEREEPTYDPDALRAALRAVSPAVASCYNRALAADPTASLRSTLAFTVQADGSVSDVSAGKLTDCIARALAGAKFPPPPNGGTVRIAFPFNTDAAPAVPPPDARVAPEPPPGDAPWTPFAMSTAPAPESAEVRARTAEPVIRAHLDAIAACFRAPAPTGSLRVMVELDGAGKLMRARAGGLGDRAAEACVERALAGVVVANPGGGDDVELACDLARGDAERWRVAPDAYDVIAGSRDAVVHAGVRFDPAGRVPDPLPGGGTYLILLEPGAPGRVLETALALAGDASAALVALHQPGRPAIVVGAGRSGGALGHAHELAGSLELAFDLSRDRFAACINGHTDSVALAVPKRVDALLAQIAARCRTEFCTKSAGLAVGPEVTAAALADAVAALRRAGFERVVIGGGIGCR